MRQNDMVYRRTEEDMNAKGNKKTLDLDFFFVSLLLNQYYIFSKMVPLQNRYEQCFQIGYYLLLFLITHR